MLHMDVKDRLHTGIVSPPMPRSHPWITSPLPNPNTKNLAESTTWPAQHQPLHCQKCNKALIRVIAAGARDGTVHVERLSPESGSGAYIKCTQRHSHSTHDMGRWQGSPPQSSHCLNVGSAHPGDTPFAVEPQLLRRQEQHCLLG